MKGMHLFPLKENLPRYKEAIKLLAKYGFSDLVLKSGLDEEISQDSVKDMEPDRKVEEFPRDLERLGPTFIKFGQFLSAFSDILPTDYQESLTRLQDQAESFDFSEAKEIIETDLGVRFSKAFDDFDTRPISAASVAQVHRAVLRNGKEVAVKVQRPDVKCMVLADLEVIRYIAEILDRHTSAGKKNHFEWLAEEFRKSILRELDFRLEAQNLRILKKNLEEFPNIQVPEPIDDYTGTRVLTMDYMPGIKMNSLSNLPQSKIDRNQLADELFQAYLKQIIIDGFFHADPHPGNILLTKEGHLALLDLGMIAHLDDEMQDSLLKILIGISEGDGYKVVSEALKIAEKQDEINEYRFSHEISDLLLQQKHRKAGEYNMGRVVLDVSKISRRNGIIIPIELTVLGKTLLNLDQVGTQLAPDFDPNDCIRRNTLSLMQTRMWKTMSLGNVLNSMMETKELISKMPHRINRILESLANNEIEVQVDAIDEKMLITGIQKIANRITMGLILAALIVGAALLMQVETDYTILGYPILAILFFLGAAIGGISLIIKILLTDERSKRR